jgi:two-component system, cell cycle sensor histidine kinase PleC
MVEQGCTTQIAEGFPRLGFTQSLRLFLTLAPPEHSIRRHSSTVHPEELQMAPRRGRVGIESHAARSRIPSTVAEPPSGAAAEPSAAISAPPDYSIKLYSLRFADRTIERRFVIEDVARSLSTIRIFLLAACLLYATFGVLDAYIIPATRAVAWTIRYAVVCPFFVGVVLLSYSRLFPRLGQLTLSLCMFVAGLGVVVMTALAEAPGNVLYYAGLIMVVIYGSSLVRLRFLTAAGISVLLVCLYQIVAVFINPIAGYLLLSNDFFLVMSVAVGVFSSYIQELQTRRDFASSELLREEKTRSDQLRAEAEAASKSKSDFLAIMSHELRTPLNAILGFSEIMQHRIFGPIGSNKYATYVDDIHHSAGHLLNVITDILDLSKAEVGKLTINEIDVDIHSLADQCLRLLRERAADQGIRLSLRGCDGEPPVMRVDATLMKQVFLNILSNAIKFTPHGGSIGVTLDVDADANCLVSFADTGIGIAAADLPRVVEPFVQVESPLSRKHGGAGLGLPIVKKIVELHGGELAITSTFGAGTTVSVMLPGRRAAAKSAGAAIGAA